MLNFLHSLIFRILMVIGIATTTTTTAAASVKGVYWFEQPFFPSSAINSSLHTHVFYAFLIPNYTTYTLQISNSKSKQLAKFTNSLRTKTPPVKTLASIGGGASDSDLFAKIAGDAAARAAFINSTIDVARRFGFDGLDLDWEFPETEREMSDLGELLRDWRLAAAAESKISGDPPLLLTAAVYFAVDFFLSATPRRYPVASINENLDFINVMSYDLHGSWNNETGAPAALFDPNSNVNVVFGLKSWIRAGLCPHKIVMGLPLYGRMWMLRDPNVNGIAAPAFGVRGSEGTLTFFQIEEFNKQKGATVVYDVDTVSAYSYSGRSWIGYDDPLTVTTKVGFAQALGLGGYFFWAAMHDRDKIIRQASKAWILA